MTREELLTEAQKLSLDEQITLAQDLWHNIVENNDRLPIHLTDEQKRELDKRYKECKEGKMELRNWEDIKSGLHAQYDSNTVT